MLLIIYINQNQVMGNNMLLGKQQAINNSKGIRVIIEPDENVGFYLLVYDLTSGKCTQDFLYFPDQLDNLYKHAMEYGVNKESFYPVKE